MSSLSEVNILISRFGKLTDINVNTAETIIEKSREIPSILSTAHLSPFPKYWAENIDVPAVIPKINKE